MNNLSNVRAAKEHLDHSIGSGSVQEAADGIAGFAHAFGKLIAETEVQKRERQRLRRNERARARYAAQKLAGTLPRSRRKHEAELRALDRLEKRIYIEENRHRCGCQDPNASPPCGHCESWEDEHNG